MTLKDARPLLSFFQNFKKNKTMEGAARELGIATNTLAAILNNEKVSKGTMEFIALRLGIAISAIVDPTSLRWLPTDPQFFESLRYGYYIDHDRNASGVVKWWQETILIKSIASKNRTSGQNFYGTVTNQVGTRFDAHGLLTSQTHFSLIGTCQLDNSEETITFNAAFSQQIDGVVCGTWSGVNHVASASTIYRIFLSADPLSKDEITKLTGDVKVEVELESPKFGFDD